MIGNRCRASDYCCEDISLIENYNEAVNSEEEYDCHHRLETHDENGELREVFLSSKELIKMGKYYNVKADELIFMPRHEHRSLHSKGIKMSEESKSKNSKAHKGRHHSEESRKKMSEAAKGRKISDEARKKMSNARKGKPKSEEHKKKIGEANKVALKGHTPWNKGKKLGSNGTHWYNNGEVNVKAKECPPGFVKGFIKR